MENEMDLGADFADGSARVQRACDSCRSRKIRCDRTTPCSNCRASKLTCITTAPAPKPNAKRVHISDKYERKIDRIEDRLAGIENVLESLAAKLSNLDLQKDPEQQSTQSRSSKVGRSSHSSNTPAPFEGETNIHVQSEFARELLKQAVEGTPSIGQNADIKAALTSLQDMVSRQTQKLEQPFFRDALIDIDSSKLERPPWGVVTDVLDKALTSMCFAMFLPFVQFARLDIIFEQSYSAPEQASTARRVVMFGVLYNLFTEFAGYPRNKDKEVIYGRYGQQCKIHLELAISQLDLLILPTYENIVALVLAGAYAVEMSKPSLCWLMISHAAGLCQNLGYHRFSTMKDDGEEERISKLNIFWFIYMLDKTLSLRLGRASSIQDWDISLPYLDSYAAHNPSLAGRSKGGRTMIYWIKVAQIQGHAYENLFSPAGFLKPAEERSRIAGELVEAMNRAWTYRGESSILDFVTESQDFKDKISKLYKAPSAEASMKRKRFSPYPSPTEEASKDDKPSQQALSDDDLRQARDLFYFSDVVVHHSTCALIQRAVTPVNTTFTEDCLASARAALRAHQKCSEACNVEGKEDLWSGYVHWSILQSPFTPFIVIFCNSISTCDLSDLTALSDFVTSLESVRTISEGADKLYKMCHLFLQVARLYIEAKGKEVSSIGQTLTTSQPTANTSEFFPSASRDTNPGLDGSAMNQFDPYLSALGLVPPTNGVNAGWPMGPTLASMQQGLSSPATSLSQVTSPHLDGSSNPIPASGFGVGVAGFNNVDTAGLAPGQNTIQDWFSGSRYIMGLMEQDDIDMPDLGF